MTVVSDTIDENGKRHLVVKYTEEEKEAMRLRKEEHEKKLKNKQKPKEAEEKKETPKKKATPKKKRTTKKKAK